MEVQVFEEFWALLLKWMFILAAMVLVIKACEP